MAWTVVAHTAKAGNTANVTTDPIDTTGADLLIFAGSSYTGGAEPTLTDSQGNTWTGLTVRTGPSEARVRVYYCQSPKTSAAHTFTYDNSIAFTYPAAAVLALSGSRTSPFDVENGNTGSGISSLATGSVTPSTGNQLLVTAITFNQPNTLAIDSGFTISDQINYALGGNESVALAYLIETTAVAKNPLWSWSTACEGAAEIATFQAPADSGFGIRTDAPHNRVGPIALRVGWQPRPLTDSTQASVTDTNFILPDFPHNRVGPTATRQGWQPRPLTDSTQSPATDTNFGQRVDLPHNRVGPMALRQGWQPTPIQDGTQAPATDTNFGVRTILPNNRVGPPVLRRQFRGVGSPFATTLSVTTYSYTGTGGLAFSGTTAFDRIWVYAPNGGVSFSGSATIARKWVYTVTGGVSFAGAATIDAHLAYLPSGGIVFAGDAATVFQSAAGSDGRDSSVPHHKKRKRLTARDVAFIIAAEDL